MAAIVVSKRCFIVFLLCLLRWTFLRLFFLLWHDCARGAVNQHVIFLRLSMK